jgi:hypothetical protein
MYTLTATFFLPGRDRGAAGRECTLTATFFMPGCGRGVAGRAHFEAEGAFPARKDAPRKSLQS